MSHVVVGFDHINRNAPVLIRTPKLTRFEPAQYLGGGPPGESVVLNPLFFSLPFFCFVVTFLLFGGVEFVLFRASVDYFLLCFGGSLHFLSRTKLGTVKRP